MKFNASATLLLLSAIDCNEPVSLEGFFGIFTNGFNSAAEGMASVVDYVTGRNQGQHIIEPQPQPQPSQQSPLDCPPGARLSTGPVGGPPNICVFIPPCNYGMVEVSGFGDGPQRICVFCPPCPQGTVEVGGRYGGPPKICVEVPKDKCLPGTRPNPKGNPPCIDVPKCPLGQIPNPRELSPPCIKPPECPGGMFWIPGPPGAPPFMCVKPPTCTKGMIKVGEVPNIFPEFCAFEPPCPEGTMMTPGPPGGPRDICVIIPPFKCPPGMTKNLPSYPPCIKLECPKGMISINGTVGNKGNFCVYPPPCPKGTSEFLGFPGGPPTVCLIKAPCPVGMVLAPAELGGPVNVCIIGPILVCPEGYTQNPELVPPCIKEIPPVTCPLGMVAISSPIDGNSRICVNPPPCPQGTIQAPGTPGGPPLICVYVPPCPPGTTEIRGMPGGPQKICVVSPPLKCPSGYLPNPKANPPCEPEPDHGECPYGMIEIKGDEGQPARMCVLQLPCTGGFIQITGIKEKGQPNHFCACKPACPPGEVEVKGGKGQPNRFCIVEPEEYY
jgi:hypothetical protein